MKNYDIFSNIFFNVQIQIINIFACYIINKLLEFI
jgi:hypothetical protein